MPIPRKPDTVPKSKKQKKKARVSFAQMLNKNIAQYSKHVMKPGGGVTVAVVNYDFCYEFTQLFIETLTQVLLVNEQMNFDQFGKFEVKPQKGRFLKNPLTGEGVYIPDFKIIRFYPSRALKDRIKGTSKGFRKKVIGGTSSEILYADSELAKMLEKEQEESEDKNIIECEES